MCALAHGSVCVCVCVSVWNLSFPVCGTTHTHTHTHLRVCVCTSHPAVSFFMQECEQSGLSVSERECGCVTWMCFMQTLWMHPNFPRHEPMKGFHWMLVFNELEDRDWQAEMRLNHGKPSMSFLEVGQSLSRVKCPFLVCFLAVAGPPTLLGRGVCLCFLFSFWCYGFRSL